MGKIQDFLVVMALVIALANAQSVGTHFQTFLNNLLQF
jgi:hypothetical protein